MKNKTSKFGLIFTIVSNICIVLCFLGGLLLMFNVELPEEMNEDHFVNYMKSKGCVLNDIQSEENYSGMETYLIADSESCPYLMSYTIFSDEDVEKEYFTMGLNDVLNGNNNVTGKFSIEINLFSKYYEYSTSGDYYKAIVLNENSILYASADKKYRDDVQNMFNDLGYKFELNFSGLKIAWCSIYIMLFICFVSMYGIMRKIRNKGWIALIPFYNIGCLSKDVLGSYWLALLLLVPIGNVVFMLLLLNKMGKVFGRDEVYCVLLMFFPSVMWPLLAFDDSKYVGKDNINSKINSL